MTERRKKAIIRRRIFIALLAALLAVLIALIAVIVAVIKSDSNVNNNSSDITYVSSEQNPSKPDNSSSQKEETPSEPEIFVTPTGAELDANFGRLLLINGEHALPDDYDTKVREYLVEIDPQYRNNNYVTQIHKDVYPYVTAMVAAAQADGVDLRVWSPFRSYAIQNDLFQKQVNRVGGDEEKAATVVARPGTSEHNTGLCADFNMASDTFETTPMYTWMCENAEDYGFILRYPKDKQHITGVIYESWHWRFVGINNAKQINELGVTLEEFIEMKKLDPTMDMYGDDSAAEQIMD
ncbi:MAG: D-alanyl-D-alanine carboxypeptidase family protein [Ruminococcaceae bacterium]|nr:D-alanyl-D-alanine carboxypeptidase family protein [Oscillospiraceae bacterium]